MKLSRYTLELIMPSFCAGAEQSAGEIRTPAIRGQLRWWFRALGGTADDERSVFGGVTGHAVSSCVVIRLRDFKRGPEWNPPRVDPNSSDSYVWYFASVSGKPAGSGRSQPGPRWSPHAVVPPKSTFTLEILQTRPLPGTLQSQFDLALRCFLQLGALGLRATRGLGAFACREVPFRPTIVDEMHARGFRSEYRPAPSLGGVESVAREIGGLVKGTRNAQHMKATAPSPFGSSNRPRQTSAIHFRPVRATAGSMEFQLVVFEAPHARILGEASRRPPVLGHRPSKLTKPF